MDFCLSEEQEQLRREVCAYLAQDLGTRHDSDPLPVSQMGVDREFSRRMGERGYLGISWPVEYGGGGQPVTSQFIVEEEMLVHGAPVTEADTRLVSSLLFLFGSDEQKRRYGPRAVRGEVEFCSGWTEPGSGSDLASLQTQAVRDGDHFLINGTKIFNTNAHRADVCWLLARTSSEAVKHAGISILLVPMDLPGVVARPLQDLLGRTPFAQISFEDVRVPVTSIIGGEGGGWRVMATAMGSEGITVYRCLAHLRVLRALRRYVEYGSFMGSQRERGFSENSLRSQLRHRLAELSIEFEVGRLLLYRGIEMHARGEDTRGASAMVKLFNSELNRRLYTAAVDILGPYGLLLEGSPRAPWEGTVATLFLSTAQDTIAGGTSEIQRNNIAVRTVKLPRA